MTTPATLTETLNTEFTETWYEIRPEAIDNILDATPISAIMREHGVFKPQVGGRKIERTVRYGEKTTFVFDKGDVLPVTEEELRTVAFFDWAYFGVPVTRTFQDDQQNSGSNKISDYISNRLEAARDALVQKLESVLMAETIHAGGKEPLSIFDYIPDTSGSADYFDSTPYTYGGLDRSELWWQHKDFTAAASASSANQLGIKDGPASLSMVDDMNNAFNHAEAQLEAPDIVITTQDLFEIYTTFAEAKEQIIRDESTRLADLGFNVLRFRSKPLIYSTSMTAGQMLMVNLNHFDIVFDPNAWFEMTDWQRPERQLEQVAYILSAIQVLGYQPRRNARIKWTTAT